MLLETDYTVFELTVNDSFLQWVLKNSPTDALFWERWQGTMAGRKEVVRQARQFIKAMHAAQDELTEQEYEADIAQIINLRKRT